MVHKMKNALKGLAVFASVVGLAGFLLAGPVYADTTVDIKKCTEHGTTIGNFDPNACTGTADTGANGNSVGALARKIVNFMSILVGVVAVIMIIVGGFKYITSGGDSNKISSAKNTIIYALIGLIIVALSQFIVQFILKNAGDAATGGDGAGA